MARFRPKNPTSPLKSKPARSRSPIARRSRSLKMTGRSWRKANTTARRIFTTAKNTATSVQIILRRHKDFADKKRRYDLHEILHAKYEFSRTILRTRRIDIYHKKVRVGRLLAEKVHVMDGRMKCKSVDDLWRHIREIGDEIRERIHKPEHTKTVTLAVDTLFANLDAHEIK